MSSTLYRKYRPMKFSEIVGQKHIVKTLSNSIESKRIGQAYLFTGPRGTGKTTLARIFAKTVNCLSPHKSSNKKNNFFEPCLKCENCKNFQNNTFSDVVEIDAASHTGVDNIRELKETAKLPPLQGKFKIYIIDEVHMLSQGAFNALLKILEEPPSHIIFILATTELHKVPETIVSRCQKFDFGKFGIDEIINKLSKIASLEEVEIENKTLRIIATIADGGMRDAESLLEQIISSEGKNIYFNKVKELFGLTDIQFIQKITDALFSKKSKDAILLVNKLYKNGLNLDFFVKNWLDYLRKIMIANVNSETKEKLFPELTEEDEEFIKKMSAKVSISYIISCINQLMEAIPKIKNSFLPQLPLEIAIIKLSHKQSSPINISKNDKNDKKRVFEKSLSKEKKRKEKFKKKEKTNISKKSSKIQWKSKIVTKKKGDKKNNVIKPIKIDIVEQNWKKIIKTIGEKNFSLSMMLTNSKPTLDKNKEIINIVVLKNFHKELINKPENRLTIKDISNKITELEFDVYAITENESSIKLKTILPKEKISEEKNNQSDATTATHNQNSLLDEALSIMGGKVVEG